MLPTWEGEQPSVDPRGDQLHKLVEVGKVEVVRSALDGVEAVQGAGALVCPLVRERPAVPPRHKGHKVGAQALARVVCTGAGQVRAVYGTLASGRGGRYCQVAAVVRGELRGSVTEARHVHVQEGALKAQVPVVDQPQHQRIRRGIMCAHELVAHGGHGEAYALVRPEGMPVEGHSRVRVCHACARVRHLDGVAAGRPKVDEEGVVSVPHGEHYARAQTLLTRGASPHSVVPRAEAELATPVEATPGKLGPRLISGSQSCLDRDRSGMRAGGGGAPTRR
mmetsp:Transcript_11451/g.33979  ORF Transcript_11451/g.33979 Transcript_11451/m.33979 type:complete len:279 (-) Transcript_11451:143-979(-)